MKKIIYSTLIVLLLILSFVSVHALPIQDNDGDGVPNSVDTCVNTFDPTNRDNEHDSLGDVCDPDDDNDGILDTQDPWPFTDYRQDRDNDGIADPYDSNVAIVNLQVSANQPQTRVGQNIAFTCTVTGGDNPVGYTFSFGDSTTATGSSSSGSLVRNHAYTTPGTKNVQCSVRDANGETRSTSTSVTIINSNPVLTVPGSQTVVEGSSVSFRVTADDVDRNTLQLTHTESPSTHTTLNPQGALVTPVTTQAGHVVQSITWVVPFDATNTGQRTFTLTFTANDGNGGTDTKAVVITVKDAPRQCENGVDDDSDGVTDLNDPGCFNNRYANNEAAATT